MYNNLKVINIISIKNKKAIIFLIGVIIWFMFYNLSIKISAFGKITHKIITEEALYQITTSLPSNKIIEGCTQFSESECSNLDPGHFYDVDCDFDKQINKDNAAVRVKKHFHKAKTLFLKNEIDEAACELGRALHYIQDISCPVHTWGYSFNSEVTDAMSFHRLYEKKIDEIDSYNWGNSVYRRNDNFRYYLDKNKTIKSLCLNCSIKTSDLMVILREGVSKKNWGKFDDKSTKLDWNGILREVFHIPVQGSYYLIQKFCDETNIKYTSIDWFQEHKYISYSSSSAASSSRCSLSSKRSSTSQKHSSSSKHSSFCVIQ